MPLLDVGADVRSLFVVPVETLTFVGFLVVLCLFTGWKPWPSVLATRDTRLASGPTAVPTG